MKVVARASIKKWPARQVDLRNARGVGKRTILLQVPGGKEAIWEEKEIWAGRGRARP